MSLQRNSLGEHVHELMVHEQQFYREQNPGSAAMAERAGRSWLQGVPMHWMVDWSLPFPLFVKSAGGAHFIDVDGNQRADFCLGDTGAMFGHSPVAVTEALTCQGARGLTTMLPGEDALWVGEELQRRFGLAYWQVATTASDANRFVLRWARAATGRKIIIVFDGCYHGTVDDAMVRLRDGKTVARSGLMGQVYELSEGTRVVPFNDLPALEQALRSGDVAAVLCEPALTNIGMVLPEDGFHASLRALTRRYGALLIIDETHTISTGPGGYTCVYGLEPDFLVIGKPIAGGLPCAVYGCTGAVAESMLRALASVQAPGTHGHSGMGTTLSANPLQMACMRATLQHLMTDAHYAQMTSLADYLAQGLRSVIASANRPWCVTQLGARVEFQFCREAPRNGIEAEQAFDAELERFLHLFWLNRGVLITPFHNMMLICPDTTRADVEHLLSAFSEALAALDFR